MGHNLLITSSKQGPLKSFKEFSSLFLSRSFGLWLVINLEEALHVFLLNGRLTTAMLPIAFLSLGVTL
jgi:hypothetical protein